MWIIPILLGAAITYWLLSSRLRILEEEIYGDGEISKLTRRIASLERSVTALEEVLAPHRVTVPETATPPEVSLPEPAMERAVHAPELSIPIEPPQVFNNAEETVDLEADSLADRLQAWIFQNDWEFLLGGNVLNKIGALVLVIGIALFTGYSFHRVGPAARACAALGTSAAILAGGIWLERRTAYRAFGRGLIGAGWAALYATTYAIYAIPAARLIENAFAGSVLLLTVAASMIVYSLRYRSQTVTTLAYFTAFLALAVTPSSPFAVLSLIPLSASLLYLAYRFDWHRTALFGLIATYVTCASRGDSNAPLWSIQSLFLVYWAVFEIFDLFRVHRRQSGSGLEWIFPLNAVGFISLSFGAWLSLRPTELWMMAAITAAMYAASAVGRFWIRPPWEFAGDSFATRLKLGSFEGPCSVAALMSGMAIVAEVPGIWTSLALALQAQFLYLAGARLRLRSLQRMGSLGFLASLTGTLIFDGLGSGKTEILGYPVLNWTPSVVLHIAVFYLNRAIEDQKLFSLAASVLFALVAAAESVIGYSGMSLMLWGALLFEFGWRKNLVEFRYQGAGIAAFGFATILWVHADKLTRPAPDAIWISLLVGSAIAWGFVARILLGDGSRLAANESRVIRDVAAASGSMLLMMAAIVLVPHEVVTVAWFAIASACLALGLHLDVISFRWLAQAILFCAFARFAFLDLADGRNWYLPAWAVASMLFQFAGTKRRAGDVRLLGHWIALLTLAVGLVESQLNAGDAQSIVAILGTVAVFYTLQLLAKPGVGSSEDWFTLFDKYPRAIYAIYATALLTAFLWDQVSGKVFTLACGVEGLVLLAVGFPLRNRALRLAGLALLLGCVCKLFLYDLRNLESFYRTLSFIALGVILLGVSWIYTRFRDSLRRYL